MTEVMEICRVDEEFLRDLEEEELLFPVRREDTPVKLFSEKDLETLRIAKILMDDMGVNLPGIEIILRMRETMFKMRSQFDDILEDVAKELQERFKD